MLWPSVSFKARSGSQGRGVAYNDRNWPSRLADFTLEPMAVCTGTEPLDFLKEFQENLRKFYRNFEEIEEIFLN